MDELDVLRNYVNNSALINNDLREGVDIPEKEIIDSFLTYGTVPHFLYRLLPFENVHVLENDTISDAAYLSCSANFDDFIDSVGCINHLACFRIENASPINRIIIRDLLQDFNDEGEYLLPRNLVLQIISQTEYNGIADFERLLEEVECFSTGSTELFYAMGIKTITLYRLRVVH